MPKVYNKHHGDAPPDAVYIGRGSVWGNPFRIGMGDPPMTRDDAVECYEVLLTMVRKDLVERAKRELVGKDLICFCAPLRCHGDYLLKIANEE